MNHFTIFITGNCNLSCAYCFEKDCDFSKAKITKEVIQAIGKLAIEQENEKSINFGFFGGEPLLYPDMIEYTCEYMNALLSEKGKQATYSVTTNATLITDDVINLLKKYNIKVLASIDGLPRDNNVRYWKGTSETSSYVAYENLLKLKQAGIPLTIRWTVSPDTVQYLYNDCVAFIEAGFLELAIEFTYETEWSIETLKLLEQQLILLSKVYIQKLRDGINLHIKPFDDGIGLYRTEQRMQTRCGYGLHGVGIGADGDIQPCHRFVSRSDHADWSFGNVLTNFDYDKRQKMIDNWDINKVKVADGRECKDCPVKLRCPGGACFPVNLDSTGDYFTSPVSYCDIQLTTQRVANDIVGILYGEQNEILIKKMTHV